MTDARNELTQALIRAGVLNFRHSSIRRLWKQVTQKELSALDVLAWHEYVQRWNHIYPRNKITPAFIVHNLEQGHAAPDENYEDAEHYQVHYANIIR